MRGRRRIAAPLGVLLVAASLAACTPALPETVIADTKITAGWTGEFTSTNAAASPTSGNIDIAATIRADFGDVIEGEFVADESFGTVSITDDENFTVRYDLAEPVWSDGIPLDAADLLLGWAGASGFFDGGDQAADGTDASPDVPRLDEFERAIEVTYPQSIVGWQSAVSAPVPAHVVGQRAFETDDAMEAKQAVIEAIQSGDASALAKISDVWNDGFELGDQKDIPADLLLSSGPFRVEKVDDGGQSVTLTPNASYTGAVTPQVAKIELVPPGDDPIALVGDGLDVAQVAPLEANREPIRELERQDFTVETSNDGTAWAMLLNPAGVFASAPARTAFIHAVQASALVEGGGGEWASAYTGTTSMLSIPGSRAYDIVSEDSGFAETLGEPGDDPGLERGAAGVVAGAPVCVLYDRDSEFAVGAFAALTEVASESGWNIMDCSGDDFDVALEQRSWNAVITRVPVPTTPEEIMAQWGTQGSASITQNADVERDGLIEQFAHTDDVYEAREVLAQVEATIVRDAVALPLAMNPRVTVIDRDVTGITSRNGSDAPLTSSVVQWAVIP